MVSYEQIRNFMLTRAGIDKEKRRVHVNAPSLEEALQQAAIELGVKLDKIEYEVVQEGSRGVAGFGKKEWLITASEIITDKDEAAVSETDFDFDFGYKTQEATDANGEVLIALHPEGIILHVTAPVGSGRKVTQAEVIEAIEMRTMVDFDKKLVAAAVKSADGQPVKIGRFDYNPANDALLTIDLLDGEMKAMLNLTPPGLGGTDPTKDTIVRFLQNNGITFGIKEDVLERLHANPVFNTPILVAEGQYPKDGEDATIRYNFDIGGSSKARLKEKNGKVDFKELNLIQNVVEGQVLAKKILPGKGESGRTVTGKFLPAKDGKDVVFSLGKNVILAEDGLTAKAAINGQVTMLAGKLTVEPIYVVQGDVNLKTGNILFLGTVLVKGNVDDGFEIKAAGNIEVMGSVGKCLLDAEGDIIVHQGITGKSTGTVRCGKSVWSKFIENSKVDAEDLVVVSDGIINSDINARRIICKGKRASIVGGELRASEEINAKTLGSVAGSETVCSVGYDPKTKERLEELEKMKAEHEKELEELILNISTLETTKKTRKKLTPEKEKSLQALIKRAATVRQPLDEIKAEIAELHEYLNELKSSGRVSASSQVYPGVKVFIKDAFLEVRSEFRSVTFVLENSLVKVAKYEETDEDISRKG